MAYNRSSDRDTGSSSYGRSSSGGGSSSGSRSSGGGGKGGSGMSGGSLRGADGMTASQRAATRDSRLGLTTGTTWRGNTAYGPAGGRATGFTNVRTGGGRMTKTQRDAVGPGTMPRGAASSPKPGPSRAQPTGGGGPVRKPVAKKAVPKKAVPPPKQPTKRGLGRVTGGLGFKPLPGGKGTLQGTRPKSWSTSVMDRFYGGNLSGQAGQRYSGWGVPGGKGSTALPGGAGFKYSSRTGTNRTK